MFLFLSARSCPEPWTLGVRMHSEEPVPTQVGQLCKKLKGYSAIVIPFNEFQLERALAISLVSSKVYNRLSASEIRHKVADHIEECLKQKDPTVFAEFKRLHGQSAVSEANFNTNVLRILKLMKQDLPWRNPAEPQMDRLFLCFCTAVYDINISLSAVFRSQPEQFLWESEQVMEKVCVGNMTSHLYAHLYCALVPNSEFTSFTVFHPHC